MRRLAWLLTAAALVAGGLFARSLLGRGADLPPPVPEGDQEVAWIEHAVGS